MAAESLTRSRAINLINGSIDSFMFSHACYCTSNMESLSEDDIELYDQMHEVISILNDDEDYRHDLETMPLEDLKEFLLMCRKMADNNNLSLKSEFPQGNFEIVEDEKTETELNPDKIENTISGTFDSEVKLKEIIYFLNNYKSVANWEYNGHGSFIAKKNATLWELGGIYWNKLFELPKNPNLIQIGDEIKLRKEVIDTIYEYSVSDVNGNYSFESKSPEVKDLIYGIISFCAGASDAVPKLIKYGLTGKDVKGTVETFVEKEETSSKLSYFIQQYSTEGQEEDAWEKMISVASFLGPVFGFLGLLSNASVEENKYQIVQYYSRKAFLNSAQIEINRIEKLQSQVKEENLQTEINYLRFLERQIKILKEEIRLNDKKDNLQKAEILRSFSQYNTKDAFYNDDRLEFSAESYHKIDYRKKFEEQK
ncbi:hypothetical protein [Treponema succinifaciens]|uniref:Uncharacterized protein n=1 Tax=Treponema succinifaciens (strain ATCC 33096 / DSM 2489 / 6091) TaxID=869209 RepID=F2NVF8_TRES6|nr:hypothetical protein [Treponema succinifaciens]AEB13668.1 hypothetical protein Tresu_0732 [Treponema succinifaciens DSM 2489]